MKNYIFLSSKNGLKIVFELIVSTVRKNKTVIKLMLGSITASFFQTERYAAVIGTVAVTGSDVQS